jgi:DNA uptake protein ComE-like DNA-binding protein
MKTSRALAMALLGALVAATCLGPSEGLAQPTPAVPKAGDVMQKAGKLIDINKASLDDLKKVPGLDESLAKKVIDGRPFKSVDELLSNKILSKDLFAKVKPLLMASQP